jgi:hypothetical protein
LTDEEQCVLKLLENGTEPAKAAAKAA